MISVFSVLTLYAMNAGCRKHKEGGKQERQLAEADNPNTDGNIILYSDNIEIAAKWRAGIEQATGMKVFIYDFNGHKARTRQAVDFFIMNNKLKELKPKAVLLQIGCDETPDATDNHHGIPLRKPLIDPVKRVHDALLHAVALHERFKQLGVETQPQGDQSQYPRLRSGFLQPV